MEALPWIALHWLDLLQSVGIVAGLLFTVHTIRTDAKSRRIGHVIAFANQHREIWKEIYARPELVRVVANEADLKQQPITHEERLFAKLLILHLDSIHRTMKEGMFVSLEGLRKDIRISFDRPVLRAVWEETRKFQDRDFVAFVESFRK